MTLLETAEAAMAMAYCPYSHYQVGAAVMADNGEFFAGANVENISFGATLCAERVAIAKCVTSGQLSIQRIAVATRDGGTPCGICLQTMLEFSVNPTRVEIELISTVTGQIETYRLSELIPHGFKTNL